MRDPIRTTAMSISSYWSGQRCESEMGCDWEESCKRCWRCGGERPLQRCHIVSASSGGPDEPWNYVLLCSICHAEAPAVEEPGEIWTWITSTSRYFDNGHHSLLYWWELQQGLMDELRSRVSEAAIRHIEESGLYRVLIAEAFRRATTHAGRYSESSLRWVIRKIFQRMTEEGERLDRGNQVWA
jgi:HNH endonuclease